MRWLNATMRLFGLCNAGLAGWGLWYLIHIVPRVIADSRPDPQTPYFMQAFLVMSGINLLLIAVLAFSGIQLLRVRPGAVRVYNWFALVTCVYFFSIGFIVWPMGGELSASIGAATGIGNMGIAPFFFLPLRLPFVYPIVSMLVLNLIRRAQHKRGYVQPDEPRLPAS